MDYRGRRRRSNAKIQKTVHTDGYSGRLYGHGGLKPTFVNHKRGWGHNPDADDPLPRRRCARGAAWPAQEKGDPYEGIQLEFVNPATGGPVGCTLQYAAQLLRPGEETLAKRETSNTFMVVMDGKGYTEVGGKRFDWEPNDIVVMPNFLWRRHVNTGKRCGALHRVGRRADEKHRPVSGAGQGSGRKHCTARRVTVAGGPRAGRAPFQERRPFHTVSR